MNLVEFASCVAAFVSIIALWRSIWDKRFDEIKKDIKDFRGEVTGFRTDVNSKFDKVWDEFKEIRSDLSEVKERVAAIEMSTILLKFDYDKFNAGDHPINKRSQAMMDYHSRRRAKKIDNRDE